METETIDVKGTFYTCANAKLCEIAPLRDYIVSILGDVTPLPEMQRLSAHNPDWMTVIRREPVTDAHDFAGAFCLLPLNRMASDRFAANAMRGADITLAHVVQNSEEAGSIYWGSILANDNRMDRAATMKAFRQRIGRLRRQSRIPVYTRPVSRDGLRVATRMGYRPVQDRPAKLGDMIYVLNG